MAGTLEAERDARTNWTGERTEVTEAPDGTITTTTTERYGKPRR